jgi:hypothetical protein
MPVPAWTLSSGKKETGGGEKNKKYPSQSAERERGEEGSYRGILIGLFFFFLSFVRFHMTD